MHTASERQRMVNPRKAYPVDPGLIAVYERTGRANRGRALETIVLLELERRGCDVGYLRTTDGFEVDFHARSPEGHVWLIQVSADVGDATTWRREIRALASAAETYPDATPILITTDGKPPDEALPPPIQWHSAAAWLLAKDMH